VRLGGWFACCACGGLLVYGCSCHSSLYGVADSAVEAAAHLLVGSCSQRDVVSAAASVLCDCVGVDCVL
jgi:hypothetical protein